MLCCLLFLSSISSDPLVEFVACVIGDAGDDERGRPSQSDCPRVSQGRYWQHEASLDLIRLRLDTLNMSAGVTRVKLMVGSCAASDEQLRFFPGDSRRDYAAANRALARV